jgi:hypothetical protein
MKINIKTIAFVGAIALVPAFAFAQAKTSPKTAAKTTATAPAKAAATHATNGIIQTADASSLVITKTAKDKKTETFVINAATVTKGAMTPGARVAVRYRTEGGQNIATAVTAKAVKAPKASSPKSGK